MNCTASFAQNARTNPKQLAVIQQERQITYKELGLLAGALARGLTDAGYEPGDRLVLVAPNSIEYVITALGCLIGGFTLVSLNTAADTKDLNNWLQHAQASLLIYDPAIKSAKELVTTLKNTLSLAIGKGEPSSLSWAQLTNSQPMEPLQREDNDLATIIYTSGTTGSPKGVMLSHGNLASNTQAIIEYLELKAGDRTLCVLPFYYSYGNSLLHTHMATGASLVLENHFLYPQKVMARVSEHGITGFSGVPSTYALLLSRTELEKMELSTLRYITQAGGPMPVAHQQQLRQKIPQAQLFIMYGQTEATARLTYLPPKKLGEKQGSAGIPISGINMKIQDAIGNPVSAHTEGEVCVSGSSIMLGYWRDETATNKALRNNYLHTGDMGYLDEDGYLFLTGRNTEFIKTGAHRVSPLEIEEIISQVRGVQEVAVTSAPDEILGGIIRAVIVPNSDEPPEEMTIKRYCKENLANYKVPRIIEFAPNLPKTSSGKIKRQEL